MVRWFWKRWVFAVVCGTTLSVGLAAAQKSNAPPGPPKVGDVITLPFGNGIERQVKVLKTEKQPDGSILSEVKDTKTGETFHLLDNPANAPLPGDAGTGKAESPRVNAPKNSTRPTDPLLPKANMPTEPSKEKEKEKERRLLGSVFGSRSSQSDASMPATTQPQQDEPRPGLLKRIFGRKSSQQAPSMPATSTSARPGPGTSAYPPRTGTGDAMPPAVRPTPSATRQPGGTNPPPLYPGGTAEPPRSRSTEPLAPPAPVTTIPVAPPAARPLPPLGNPAPLPLPTTPRVPTIPAPPSAPPATNPVPGGLPTIPIPPGGLSSAKPGVVQAGHAATMPPARADVLEEIRSHATALRSGTAPSQRALAARALAGGRHGSSDTVKSMLFGTAQDDPCALVRAVCIEELCKLGYHEPAFLAHLKKACDDPSPDVSTAAKDALKKMTPKK
jgi:hypothetical protein